MIGWDFFIALVARLWYNGFKGDNGMIYYGMITAAVAMFSIQFFFKNIYRNARGSGTGATLEFSALSSLAGMAVLFIMNGLRFEFTAFSLLMAALSAVNSISFTFCSLTALGKINLSLYSVFSMLGGMVLPFAAGIIFFDEPLRAGKIVCLLFITAALCVTIQRDKCRSGTGYYIGVFALNGMSGVLSKIFQASPFEKTSAAGYSPAPDIARAPSGIRAVSVRDRRSHDNVDGTLLLHVKKTASEGARFGRAGFRRDARARSD